MSPGTLYGSIRKMLDEGLIEELFRRGADGGRRAAALLPRDEVRARGRGGGGGAADGAAAPRAAERARAAKRLTADAPSGTAVPRSCSGCIRPTSAIGSAPTWPRPTARRAWTPRCAAGGGWRNSGSAWRRTRWYGRRENTCGCSCTTCATPPARCGLADVHAGRHRDAGARHRRQHGDLQRRPCRGAPVAPQPRLRPPGAALGEERQAAHPAFLRVGPQLLLLA